MKNENKDRVMVWVGTAEGVDMSEQSEEPFGSGAIVSDVQIGKLEKKLRRKKTEIGRLNTSMIEM